jgi:hypothetical protein
MAAQVRFPVALDDRLQNVARRTEELKPER